MEAFNKDYYIVQVAPVKGFPTPQYIERTREWGTECTRDWERAWKYESKDDAALDAGKDDIILHVCVTATPVCKPGQDAPEYKTLSPLDPRD